MRTVNIFSNIMMQGKLLFLFAALDDKGADSSEWLESRRTIKAFFEKQASVSYHYEDYVLTDRTGNVVFALNSPQLEGVDLSQRVFAEGSSREYGLVRHFPLLFLKPSLFGEGTIAA